MCTPALFGVYVASPSSQYSSVQYAVVHYCNYRLHDSGSDCVGEPGATESCNSASVEACEQP